MHANHDFVTLIDSIAVTIGAGKETQRGVHSLWGHFLHNWHCTHTYRDLLCLHGSPQTMQGHSSSSLLSDETRGFLTAFDFPFDGRSLARFPFDGFATRFARCFGRRSFLACCMTNFALCGDDVSTVAHSATRDLARGREILGKGESSRINSLTVSCACPEVGRDGPAVGGANAAVGGADPEVGGANPEVGGADPAVGGADVAVGGADPEVGGADVAVGGADPEVGGADIAVGGADVAVGGADVAVGGADVAVGGADPEVGGADPAVGGANVAVGGAYPKVGGADVAVGGADPALGGADVAVGGADVAVGGADIAVGGADLAVADADAAVGCAGCSVGCVGTAVVAAGPVTPVTAVCNIGASSVTNDAMKSSSLKMFSSNGQIPQARKPAMAFSGVEDLWKALPTSAAMS